MTAAVHAVRVPPIVQAVEHFNERLLANEHMNLDEIAAARFQLNEFAKSWAQYTSSLKRFDDGFLETLSHAWSIINFDGELLRQREMQLQKNKSGFRVLPKAESTWQKVALIAGGFFGAGLVFYNWPYQVSAASIAIATPYILWKSGVFEQESSGPLEPGAPTGAKPGAKTSPAYRAPLPSAPPLPSLHPAVPPRFRAPLPSAPPLYPDIPHPSAPIMSTKCTIVPRGDLFMQDVEVLVNSANSQLRAGGGLCGQFLERAGQCVFDECARIVNTWPNRICPPGGALITSGGDLNEPGSNRHRAIVHAVGPDLRVPEQKAHWQEILSAAYKNALFCASQYGKARSIALPVLSSGIYNTSAGGREIVPIAQLQATALQAIEKYAQEHPDHFDRINLVFQR